MNNQKNAGRYVKQADMKGWKEGGREEGTKIERGEGSKKGRNKNGMGGIEGVSK